MIIYISLIVRNSLLIWQRVVIVNDVVDVSTFRPKFYLFDLKIF